MSAWIYIHNGIVITICKHIESDNPSTCGCIAVSRDETTDLRRVISALEIIQSGLGIELVSTVAQRILIGKVGVAAGNTQMVAPCIVNIGCNTVAARVYNARNIALQVLQVVVFGCGAAGLISKAYGRAILVVTEVQSIAACYIRCQQTTVIGVCMACLRRTQTCIIIGEVQCSASLYRLSKLSAALVSIRPTVIGRDITPISCSVQILPLLCTVVQRTKVNKL